MSAPPRLTYHPGDSFLHRLHPLVKLGWLLWLSLLLFVSPRREQNLLMAVVLAVLALAIALYWRVGLRVGRGMRGSRLLLGSGIAFFLLQALFVRRGMPLFCLWPWGGGAWPVTVDGVRAGVIVGGRFLAIILLSMLTVATTDPSQLAYALMRAGLPYRYGFALVTALRLAPLFELEGSTVYEAQLARGVRYDVRSPTRLWKLLRQLLLPLLVSALGKVDALAISMEGRAFGRYPTRTFVRQVQATRADRLALLALGVAVAAGMALWWRVGR